jgi:hypothetical protein
MIFAGGGGVANPDVVLDFGPNNALGAVSFPKLSPNMYRMDEYFCKIARG